MNIDQFNQAREKVKPFFERTIQNPSADNVADMLMACAINGLVVMPSDDSDYIPTPICGFMSLPNETSNGKPVPCYIFPANQALP